MFNEVLYSGRYYIKDKTPTWFCFFAGVLLVKSHGNLGYGQKLWKLVPTECSQQSDSSKTSYKSFPVDKWKESQPAETKLGQHGAAQCQPQPTSQKSQVNQLKHAAWFQWVGRFWKAPWNPSQFISYSFTVQNGDRGYSCKKQGLFETATFKYSHWNRIEISCQDQAGSLSTLSI